MTRRVLRSTALTVLLLVGVGACGDDGRGISDDAARSLQAKVTEVRAHASARDAEGMTMSLNELQAMVEQLRAAGEISDDNAEEILAAASAVQANAASITTTTTSPPPEDDDDDDEDDNKDDEGDKGRGKDGKPDD